MAVKQMQAEALEGNQVLDGDNQNTETKNDTEESGDPQSNAEGENFETGSEEDPEEAPDNTGGEDPQGQRDFERDSFFAEQRRLQENAALKAELERAQNLLGGLLDGESMTEILDNLEAQILNTDVSDIRSNREKADELSALQQNYEALSEAYVMAQAENQIKEDLRSIQEIDSSIKDLETLGETFLNLRMSGVSAVDAYNFVKYQEAQTQKQPPQKMGEINSSGEKTYFTREEVMKMSAEEERKYHDIILESMKKWR